MRCNATPLKRGLFRIGLGQTLFLAAGAAFAHHPMGGDVPATFFQGLLSGFGHPIIGLDHFAFLVAVGLVAALHAMPYRLPLAFIAAMAAGVLIHAGSVGLPGVEIAVAASVVVLGVLAIRARALPWAAAAALMAVAGVFHGHAFGEAIVGAEATPLLAYLAGLAVLQYGICAGVAWIVRSVATTQRQPAAFPRIAGGVACGAGAVFLAQNLTAALS